MEKKVVRRRLRSKFITLEGSEGTGKSTQAQLLVAFLKKMGVPVVLVRDPGSTPIGEKIRLLLLDPRSKAMCGISEMLLYMAARNQLVEEVIVPSLKKGKTVISDRFLDATRVYQGCGEGVEQALIEKVGKSVTKGIAPDLTLLLDVSLKKGLTRSGREDRIEQKPFRYHKKIKSGYLKLARRHRQRIKTILIKDTILNTQERIRKVLLEHFGII